MSYNVLIVDDEPLARAGLRTLYDWSANGFKVVGEASNGKRALHTLKEHPVDIVITDISMPVMDGLELSKAVREQYPNVKIVLLSCHNEFEFAREGMRLGASDYLLKARLEPNDLHRSLSRVQAQLIQEKRSHGERSLLAALEGFEEWRPPAAGRGPVRYAVAVCSPEAPSADRYDRLTELFYRLLPNGYAVRYGNKQIVLWCPVEKDRCAPEQVTELHGQWQQAGLACTVGISAVYHNDSELTKAYQEALSSLQRIFFDGSGCVYTVSQHVRSGKEMMDSAKFQECKIALKHALTEGFTEKGYELLIKIAASWDAASTRAEVADQAKEIVHVLLSTAPAHKADWAEQLAEIDRCSHIRALKAHLFILFDRVCPANNENKGFHGKWIQKAVDYIKSRYHEDIGLSDAAAHISMSRNYFSEQFKKHTGMTFIDFLTSTRLHAAKQLLQEGNYKIYEVAERCGFNDVKHFSKQFRKVFGMSPKECQGK
ncbi:response regulator [Paenibacillus thermotolerans]|uniref:response regulator n=1 Tax=Paenibacillus thermotolerans TaxID=3027807 RepID=UPI002367FB54|nr:MULTISPECIES: response regulator [unclassified Paenibacillus]